MNRANSAVPDKTPPSMEAADIGMHYLQCHIYVTLTRDQSTHFIEEH